MSVRFFLTSPNLQTHILKTLRLCHSMCGSPNYTTLLTTISTRHMRTGSIQGFLPSGLAPHRFSVGRIYPTTEGKKTNEMTSTDVSTDTPSPSLSPSLSLHTRTQTLTITHTHKHIQIHIHTYTYIYTLTLVLCWFWTPPPDVIFLSYV